MISVGLVAIHEVDAAWPAVAPFMEKALEACPNNMAQGWLHGECRSGRQALYVAQDDGVVIGAWTVKHDLWRDGPVLDIVALGGERLPEWRDKFRDAMIAAAQVLGARSIVATGRKGLGRAFGGQHVASTFELRVNP